MTFEMYLKEIRMDARAEGFVEGFIEGFIEGRKEARLQMVKNFLLANTPIEYIEKATGWSEEKILQISKNLNNSAE